MYHRSQILSSSISRQVLFLSILYGFYCHFYKFARLFFVKFNSSDAFFILYLTLGSDLCVCGCVYVYVCCTYVCVLYLPCLYLQFQLHSFFIIGIALMTVLKLLFINFNIYVSSGLILMH
jgi:hypothetical protein